MNCENCFILLDEYVGRELNENKAFQVASHLTDCADCAGFYEKLKREQEIYSQYSSGVGPKPELWAGVRAGIEQSRLSELQNSGSFQNRLAALFGLPSSRPAFAVLSLALLISIAAVTVIVRHNYTENALPDELVLQNEGNSRVQSSSEKQNIETPRNQSIPDKETTGKKQNYQTTVARITTRGKSFVHRPEPLKPKTHLIKAAATPIRPATIAAEVVNAEREYINAIAILSRHVVQKRQKLSPEMNSQFEQSLDRFDRTINETRRAVKAQPGDPVAIQYMTTAYSKKVEFLRMLAEN